MQIPSSAAALLGLGSAGNATRNGAAGDHASTGAGFASLLLQTHQVLQAPPLPAPVPPPRPQPQPVAQTPAPAPMKQASPAPAEAPQTSQSSTADDSAGAAEPATKPPDAAAAAPAEAGTTASTAGAAAQIRRSDAARAAQRATLRSADSAPTAPSDEDAGADDAANIEATSASKDATTKDDRKGADDAAARRTDWISADAASTRAAMSAALPPAGAEAASSLIPGRGKGRGPGGNAGDDGDVGSATIPGFADAVAGRKAAGASAPASAAAVATGSSRAIPAATPAAGNAFAALLAEQRAPSESNDSRRIRSIDDGNGTSASVVNALGFSPTGPTTGGAATAQTVVDVATPVNAPDFGQQLGVQVSVLAKDGVQHAELHLNPADMGPVSVQITIDGTQARVDFGAEVAATRHAIEAGLPALASALADAGFTLAGGGVSQHAGGDRGDASGGQGSSAQSGRSGVGAGASASAGPLDSTHGGARILRRTVAAGGVDLYA